MIAFRRVERGLIRRLDGAGGLEAGNIVGALADDVVAGKAEKRSNARLAKI